MKASRFAAVLAAAVTVAGLATPAHAGARTFTDCNAVHQVYVNGIARSAYTAAHPSPSWIGVKAPAVSADLYTANRKLDRDGDGIACEVSR